MNFKVGDIVKSLYSDDLFIAYFVGTERCTLETLKYDNTHKAFGYYTSSFKKASNDDIIKELINFMGDQMIKSTKDFIQFHLDDACDVYYEKACNNSMEFLENIYEIAFGDDAINKGYTEEEVLERLTDFNVKSYKYESLCK